MAFPDYRQFVHPVPGNIDLSARPIAPVDGGYATVRSIGIGTDDGEVLIPTVSDDGRIMADDEAVDAYMASGKHLGIFPTQQQASHYADVLHRLQEAQYARPAAGALRGLGVLQ